MDLTDIVTRPVRAVLGTAEHEVERAAPVRALEQPLLEAVAAIHRATESIEAQVRVLESLERSLPQLSEAVAALTVQLGQVIELTSPLARAEQEVEKAERELGMVGRLFSKHQ